MPGVDLNLDLPTLADTFSDVVTKLVTAIEAIAADIEPRITGGQLEINTEVSMGGAPLINVGGLRLAGGETTVPGAIYVNGDHDFLVTTDAGPVQLTLNGTINVAALGTIGGDYGGINPAVVYYDNTSGEYRFTEEPGVWADVAVDDLLLNGDAGILRLQFDDAATGYALTLPAAPASTLFAQVSAAGVVSLSNSAASPVTAPDFRYTTTQIHHIPSTSAQCAPNTWTFSGPGWTPTLNGALQLIYPVVVRNGDTITGWSLYSFRNSGAGTILTVGLYSMDSLTRTLVVIGSAVGLLGTGGNQVNTQSVSYTATGAAKTVRFVITSSTNNAVDIMGDLAVSISRP